MFKTSTRRRAGSWEKRRDPARDADPSQTAASPKAPTRAKSGGWRRSKVLLPLVGLAIVAAVWEFVGRVVVTDRLLFAPFSTTMVALYHLVASGEILPDLKTSFVEFVFGYAIAAVTGITLGAIFAASESTRRLFSATVQAGYATPIIALAPPIIILFGVGLTSKVVVVAAMAVFPILIGTEGALSSINPEYVETARAFGANRIQSLRSVTFPAAAGGVLTGLRLGVGRGIIGVVVAEFFGASQGLGFLLIQYSNTFQVANTLAVVVLLAAIGVVSNSFLLFFEKRVQPWNRGEK
jgi:ABC-type nitrate/sulfonate/bicarbonate transport system permease component